MNLAATLHALGDRSGAAEQLTIALRINPTEQRAAASLARVLADGIPKDQPRLDPEGIKAALSFATVDGELIAAAGFHLAVSAQPLRGSLENGRRDGWLTVARRLCKVRTHDVLKSGLFITLLSKGLVSHPGLELLLIALRRTIMLDLARVRLRDEALREFIVALIRQCWTNEFVWDVSPEERAALVTCRLDVEGLRAGTPEAGDNLLLRCLYVRPRTLQREGLDVADLDRVMPEGFRQALKVRLEENREIAERGASVAVLSPPTDDTSRLVSGQYEASPYPRWSSVQTFGPGYLEHIKSHFPVGQLDFARGPFEVLIAGCGTGRQAVSAALDYGTKARITAFDISRSSLGYAGLMASRMGLKNISLAAGDINAVSTFEPSFERRFHIIECTGVLHHMADPFAAWQRLIACLAPGGIMLVGLYSASARRHLATLKAEPTFPGSGADEDALRRYRRGLLDRPGDWPGSTYLRSRDAHTTSGFRDFFLHVSEKTTSLPEIARFLGKNNLSFRGFVNYPIEALRMIDPGAVFPGELSRWAEWEERNPNAFSSMYQFWCSKT